MFVFPAKSDSCSDRVRHRGQFVIIQEVIFLRKINWEVPRDGVMKWLERDETTFVSQHKASVVGLGGTGSDNQPFCAVHNRQHCFLCAPPMTSLAGTDVNEERLHLFLSDTETESPNPLLMTSGKRNKERHCFTLCMGGGGWVGMPNMAYTSKTKIRGRPLHSLDT